ncbi:MAG: hypothetical protein KKB81_06685 [Candidatus Margulisbacteria bacterium]|nr:hypothetical protein [Candidatus Margulisiibacteriota bacterium]MBU1022483.1 hypothetical protein [Candidatus Margulisiibacteriota bacterium]MBU1728467.1 hypothetical protein [Candidatus Margulisiibacteriota bacterium]MBU1954614.1 hypothetical protein [Candidatus Margulisiibacteriota bacterium]
MPKAQYKTYFDKMQEALGAFWNDFNKHGPIKARHTEVHVKPKFFINGELNPQVAQKIVEVYLQQVSVKQILTGQVVISEDKIRIKNEKGKVIFVITNQRLIGKMINQATVLLGRYLAEQQKIEARKNQVYSFGDIQKALIDLVGTVQRNDSKNLVKDATVIIMKDMQLKR